MTGVQTCALPILALYNYVRGNLKFSPTDLVAGFARGKAGTAPARRGASEPAAEREVADWFLSELARVSGVAPACTVLLIDADRYAIYEPRLAAAPKDSSATRRHLIERGQALGFRVIDLEPVFRAEYARTRLKFDHWPIDRHWNLHGHAVAANAVLQTLFAGASSTACRPGGVTGSSANAERATVESSSPAVLR